MQRRGLGLAAISCLVLVGAAVAHLAYWYGPRLRPAAPRMTTLPARIFTHPDYTVSLWIPFPHQNLEHLHRDLFAGDEETFAAAVRLAGLGLPELPSFGPFAIPPASELAVAWSEGDHRLALCARIYPSLAIFARLAGRLADNPWLAGGEVVADGRRFAVAWHGNTWLVATGEMPNEATLGSARLPTEEVLGRIEVRADLAQKPAGSYRIRAQDGAFEIISRVEPPPLATAEAAGNSAEPFLLRYARARGADGDSAQALVYFLQEEAGSHELPRVAVLFEPGAERWPLPGEDLMDLSGRTLKTAKITSWNIAAIDSVSLTGAHHLAPFIDRTRRQSNIAEALWLDIAGGQAEAARLATMMAQLPLVPSREVTRWRDTARLLESLARQYSNLEMVVSHDPHGMRLGLEPRDRPLGGSM